MKNNFLTYTLLCLLTLSGQHMTGHSPGAQDSVLAVYVWDFDVNSEELMELGGWLTDD
jgi:hypothetical protein